MSLCSVAAAGVTGGIGYQVTVEVHIGRGLPTFTILGRPDDICRESRDRIRAALINSGFLWPAQRITMNLSPADHRKVGSALDVAMALALLIGDEQIPAKCTDGLAFVGELALDGRIRPVVGVAPMMLCLKYPGDAAVGPAEMLRTVVVPIDNAREASMINSVQVRVAETLGELVECLIGQRPWLDRSEVQSDSPHRGLGVGDIDFDQGLPVSGGHVDDEGPDLSDVRGQASGRLGVELAASGGHHLLLVGPPGSGKTMLAERLPGLLPPLDDQTALEATLMQSASRGTRSSWNVVRTPPMRAPHHSASTVSIVGGGGSQLRPGEVSLAHGGVLFLDELGEFAPSTLDGLRQPLESGVIHIARAETRSVLPARFILVGATNPCPCGHGTPGSCECDEAALAKYRRRFSGPLVDRFDLRVLVSRPTVHELLDAPAGESSALVRNRVATTRDIAVKRQGFLNARLTGEDLETYAPIDSAGRDLFRRELESGRLTGRGLHRLRRVARTLADRRGEGEVVEEVDIATALALRAKIGGRHGVGR